MWFWKRVGFVVHQSSVIELLRWGNPAFRFIESPFKASWLTFHFVALQTIGVMLSHLESEPKPRLNEAQKRSNVYEGISDTSDPRMSFFGRYRLAVVSAVVPGRNLQEFTRFSALHWLIRYQIDNHKPELLPSHLLDGISVIESDKGFVRTTIDLYQLQRRKVEIDNWCSDATSEKVWRNFAGSDDSTEDLMIQLRIWWFNWGSDD